MHDLDVNCVKGDTDSGTSINDTVVHNNVLGPV